MPSVRASSDWVIHNMLFPLRPLTSLGYTICRNIVLPHKYKLITKGTRFLTDKSEKNITRYNLSYFITKGTRFLTDKSKLITKGTRFLTDKSEKNITRYNLSYFIPFIFLILIFSVRS